MDVFATSSTLQMRYKHFFHLDLMGGETRKYGKKFGRQGIIELYPYSRYNGANTYEVDLYI